MHTSMVKQWLPVVKIVRREKGREGWRIPESPHEHRHIHVNIHTHALKKSTLPGANPSSVCCMPSPTPTSPQATQSIAGHQVALN